MRHLHPSYNIDALFRLFGKSRQAYYERMYYVYSQSTENDVIFSLVRDVRKDFPRMGCRKLLIYLRPQFEAMGITIGRYAFFELLYSNFLLVRKLRNRRKPDNL